MDTHAPDRTGWVLGGLGTLLALAVALAMGGGALAQDDDSIDDPDRTCPPNFPPSDYTDRDAIPHVHLCGVDELTARGILEGFPDGEFKPAWPLTRGQHAALVFRVLLAADVELPEAAEERFADVAPGSVHDEAIHRLAAAGVVQGGPLTAADAVFGQQLLVRRDQMASMLMRAAGFAVFDDPTHYEDWPANAPEDSVEHPGYPDVPPSNVHHGNILGGNAQTIVFGFSDGTYRPGDTARRDQLSSSGMRLLFHLESHLDEGQ